MSLGLPPRQFDFAYRDTRTNNNYQREKASRHCTVYKKYADLPLEDYVSVIMLQLLINLMGNLGKCRWKPCGSLHQRADGTFERIS